MNQPKQNNTKFIRLRLVTRGHTEALGNAEQHGFKGYVSRVTAPSHSGEITILLNHVSIISKLEAGTITFITNDGDKLSKDVSSGFLVFNDNECLITFEKNNTKTDSHLDVSNVESLNKKAKKA